MFSDIFRVVYRHAQNFGKENTLSAILASMIEFSPKVLLTIMDSVGIAEDSAHRSTPVSGKLRVETGVNYFCPDENEENEYRFCPDILVYTGDSFDARSTNRFILIESKLNSSLTLRQQQGYPYLKQIYGEGILLLQISNSPARDAESIFDHQMSWQDVSDAIENYIEGHCDNLAEQSVLEELFDSMHAVGVDFRALIFRDVEPAQPLVGELTTHEFVKFMRKRAGLTQTEFARTVGVGLRFIRDLEQGKTTVRTDKVNDVLKFFNCELGPIKTNNQQNDER